MAVVTVRAFGALRELVGARVEVDAASVAALLARLADQHGSEFVRRMQRTTVVVDEAPTEHDDTTPLRDGAEVVLLPPFAGGCGASAPHAARPA